MLIEEWRSVMRAAAFTVGNSERAGSMVCGLQVGASRSCQKIGASRA